MIKHNEITKNRRNNINTLPKDSDDQMSVVVNAHGTKTKKKVKEKLVIAVFSTQFGFKRNFFD